MYSQRSADSILFHHQGGVDIGNVEEKASKLQVKFYFLNIFYFNCKIQFFGGYLEKFFFSIFFSTVCYFCNFKG